uniref:SET domain-containing protein n=1 Tax=Syphacia muris TaxID=451379 RepID=A0A0N5A7T8_9BILA
MIMIVVKIWLSCKFELLQVFKTVDKGYGLRCSEQIRKGQFISEYAGEVIGASEVRKRAANDNVADNYIFVVKEIFSVWFLDKKQITYVDARFHGNLARYINHSCSPNLDIVLVRIGSPLVHIGLFAKYDIPPNEELTYDYGVFISNSCENVDKRCLRPCLCRSFNCKGYLPTSNM